MKKSCTCRNIMICLLVWVLVACQQGSSNGPVADDPHGGHIGYALDSNILKLVKPASGQIVSALPVITLTKERRLFSATVQGVVNYDLRQYTTLSSRVAGRIEQLRVSYNYQPVAKGQLIMEIYSPALASAQRELIYLVESGAEATLIDALKQKIMLLGVSRQQIEKALAKSEPIYNIPVYSKVDGYIAETVTGTSAAATAMPADIAPSAAGDGMGMGGAESASNTITRESTNPDPLSIRQGQYVTAGQALFTIYSNQSLVAEFSFPPALAAHAVAGKRIMYYPSGQADKTTLGTIGLIQPVQQSGQHFTRARVYGIPLKKLVGTQLTGQIAIASAPAYWVPRQAIVQTGSQGIIFRKQDGLFKPHKVSIGLVTADFVEVLEDVYGWEVAKNAYFLVDSESFISINAKEDED